jgi:DNA-binding MarR family transcriptional regulator
MATNELVEPVAAELAGELRILVGRLSRALRRYDHGGLTPSRHSALATLDRRGAMRLGDLAAIEAISPPTLTRIVQRLEDAGLVARRPDPADARAALIDLTRAGRDRLSAIRAERSRAMAAALTTLTDAERAALGAAVPALHRLVEELREDDDA